MNLFAKPAVTWHQPEAFRVKMDQGSALINKWWLRPVALGAVVSINMLAWLIATFTPGKHPAGFIVAFLGFTGMGIVMLYLYPWLLRRAPGTVFLFSFGIIRMGEQGIRSFKKMSGYNLSEEGSYHVLRLITKKGRTLLYGVPDPMTRDKI